MPDPIELPEGVERLFEQQRKDDCLWACIATILGRDPLEGHAWREPLTQPTGASWNLTLDRFGYRLIVAPPFAAVDSGVLWILLIRSLHEATGHAVVMRGRQLVHDPGKREPRYDQKRIDAELAAAVGAGAGRSALLLVPKSPAAIIAQEREKWEAEQEVELALLGVEKCSGEGIGFHNARAEKAKDERDKAKAQALAELREELKQIFGRARVNAIDGAELAVLEQIERNLSALEQEGKDG